jgi:hypothetical protein
VWSLREKFIGINQIVERGYTLCFAARWEGQKRIHFYSRWDHGHDRMVQAAFDLLNEADVVIHYNGKKFDIPTLNREFAILGYHPPENYQQIDMYQIVRSTFRFISNGMDAVCDELGLARKTPHKGFKLWEDVMAGEKEACRQMKEYNIQDIVVLEELYKRLQGWIRVHPNRGLYVQDPENPVCPNCGGQHVQKRGIERPARLNAYQRYKCMDCGANSRGRVIVERAGDNVLR